MLADPLTTDSASAATTTPTARLLTGSLVVAPLIYLAADTTYAVRGWDDPIAGTIHVIGAIGYGFVILRIAAWLPPASRLAAAILLVGLIGMAGNVAYGFDAIHTSLGDIPLVQQPGAANLIKPLGLFFPFSFLLVAVALARMGERWRAGLLLLTVIGWPIAHIGNIAPLSVVVNIALVIVFGSLAWARGARPA